MRDLDLLLVRILSQKERVMTYNPGRGGHAPNDLRGEFQHILDDVVDRYGDTNLSLEIVRDTAWRFSGTLWSCGDIMPQALCEELDLTRGGTYARGHLRTGRTGTSCLALCGMRGGCARRR
jgi:hypothetical protein